MLRVAEQRLRVAIFDPNGFGYRMGWAALYLVIALGFLLANQREQAGRPVGGWRVGGAMLCLVWPAVLLTLATIIVARHIKAPD
jgi:hypothetical protein